MVYFLTMFSVKAWTIFTGKAFQVGVILLEK